jgi:flavin reductase (DIM6/NTAB) family NADH-FMN oxidoreductase RutF
MSASGAAVRRPAAWVTGTPMSTTPTANAFHSVFRHHPAGVAIITGDPGGEPVALTVSSVISVSAAPPTIAFSLSEASSSARALVRAETVVVHFVRRKNMQLARLCATSGSNRFGPEVQWTRLATGEPYYPQIELWFRAAIRGRLSAPGACLLTAELLSASTAAYDPPLEDTLVYADRGWHGLRPLADANREPPFVLAADSATF